MNVWKAWLLLWPRTKIYTAWSLMSQGHWSRIPLFQSSPLPFNLRFPWPHIQCGCTYSSPLSVPLTLAPPFPSVSPTESSQAHGHTNPQLLPFSMWDPCLQRTEVAQRVLKHAMRFWRRQAKWEQREPFFLTRRGPGGKGKANSRDWGIESEIAEHTG